MKLGRTARTTNLDTTVLRNVLKLARERDLTSNIYEQISWCVVEEGHRPGRRPKVDAAPETEVFAAAAGQPAGVRRALAKWGR